MLQRKLFEMFHVTSNRGGMAENVTKGNILDHLLLFIHFSFHPNFLPAILYAGSGMSM